jgi:hypothetical protein
MMLRILGWMCRNRTSSNFLAQAPEVRIEEVCGGIALSGIDRGKRACAYGSQSLAKTENA